MVRGLAFGASGVDLFFVLSGFLITGILLDSQQEPFFFRKFYVRRALRIFPLYYCVLGCFALTAFMKQQSSGGELWSLALYLQNTRLLALPIWQYQGALPLPLVHFWSLAVEEQFYLIWPVLVFLLQTRKRLLAVCATSVLVCPILRLTLWITGSTYTMVHTSTYCRADALCIGGALALLLRGPHHDRIVPKMRWLALGLVPVLLLRCVGSVTGTTAAGMSVSARAVLSFTYTCLALGYAGLLSCALAPHSSVQSFFGKKPLRMLGRYSYGLYVLHQIVFSYAIAVIRAAVQRLHVGLSFVSPLSGLVILLASLAGAVLSYHFYEAPFLRLKRYFEYRRPPQPVVRTALEPAAVS